MRVWRAFRNMVRAVTCDPVWALSTVSLNLVRRGEYVLGTILTGGIVLFVLASRQWVRISVLLQSRTFDPKPFSSTDASSA